MSLKQKGYIDFNILETVLKIIVFVKNKKNCQALEI